MIEIKGELHALHITESTRLVIAWPADAELPTGDEREQLAEQLAEWSGMPRERILMTRGVTVTVVETP